MKLTIKKHVILSLCLTIIFSNTVIADTYSENANAKITLTVVDEAGLPVENARVGVGFIELLLWDSKSTGLSGNSDSKGFFSASHNSSYSVGYRAEKDGYYQTVGQYKFDKIKNSHWEPWNPEITVVLRKKENPVPMYLRNTKLTKIYIPVVGKEVGFDLAVFDWVPPYGKGKVADFVFNLEREYKGYDNFNSTLTLVFSNKLDGMQVYNENRKHGSIFKLPRFAPVTGYNSKFVFTKGWDPQKGNQESNKEDNNYFFRIRSEEKDGKLVRAMYGKIHGDIRFDPRGTETAAIIFKYFLNPDYTRNMEFGSNLFKGLNVGMD